MKAKLMYMMPLIIFLGIMLPIFWPYTVEYTIVKDEINSIKPFAGIIENTDTNESYQVGTHLACDYWLEKELVPDTLNIRVTKPFVLSAFGYIYNYEIISFSS